jgi:hypothetical protein
MKLIIYLLVEKLSASQNESCSRDLQTTKTFSFLHYQQFEGRNKSKFYLVQPNINFQLEPICKMCAAAHPFLHTFHNVVLN